MRKLYLLVLILLPLPAHAQLWSGILNSTRATDWANTGSGIIQSRTTICATPSLTAGTGAAAANTTAINNAISGCAAGAVVSIPAGTWYVNGVMLNGKSNITVRGAGAASTDLIFQQGTGCGGIGGDVCIIGGGWYGGDGSVQPGQSNAAAWPGSYTQASTSILLSNIGSAGITNGQPIVLDQANDTTDTGGYFVCDSLSPVVCHHNAEDGSSGRTIGGLHYSQEQVTTVTAGCATACRGAGPFAVTISPGLRANNWRSGQAPGAWWGSFISGVGVEDMTLDHTSSSDSLGLTFFACNGCWAKGIRSIDPSRAHVEFYQTFHNVLRDSYLYLTQNASTQSYGVEFDVTSDALIENNIFDHLVTPVLAGNGSSGNVIGYNFSANSFSASTYLFDIAPNHDAGNHFNLYEGNDFMNIDCDDVHGTGSGAMTVFRNYVRGWQSGKTNATNAIQLSSYCRAYNMVGNVFGTFGYHNNYEASPTVGHSASCQTSIYQIGYGGGDCGGDPAEGVIDDAVTRATLMRWGNYDVVNGSVQWNSSEVPTAATAYLSGNTVPASHTMPASFYLSSQPSWWGSVAWPAVGPDVTGGNVANVGGFAYQNPAMNCFLNVMGGVLNGTGGLLTFNPATCYTSAGPTRPTVTTTAASSITTVSATAGGNVTADGGASVTARGVCYGPNLNPTTPCTSNGIGTGVFSSPLSGLSPNTIYHFRAYATNSVGTAYGLDLTFTTLTPAPTLPTVFTIAATGITQTTATSGGNVTSDGGASVTSRGVCRATTANPTTSDTCTSNGTGIGSFVANLSGMTASTTYHIRAFAINSVGTAYGSDLTFRTLDPIIVLPTVTTTAASNIQQTTATAGGTVTADGGATVSARGTCWGTSANPTTGGTCTSDGTGTGVFVSSITGLSASTIYHIRAFATNSAGTSYGADLIFTTQPPTPVVPTVTTTTASAIAQTTATAGGNVTSDGGASVTARGVCYATTGTPFTPCTSDGTGIGSFTSSLTGLTAGTTYFYRAYATNSAGTAYGVQLQFTTLTPAPVLPTVTTTTPTNIAQTTATSGGTITADGGAPVTARGVAWATTANPTVGGSHTTNGTGTGTFISSITGLTAATLYHVRAYAVNSVGTAYGSDLTFTTLNPPVILPTVTTTPASAIGLTTATAGGNVTSDGGGAVTARGTAYGTGANPTISGSHTSDGSGTGIFTSSITSLSNSTLYHIRAYATNSAGTSYGADLTFSTQTPAPSVPTVSTTVATSITQTTASSGGNISSDGGASVTARGTCWALTANPVTGGSCTSDGTGIGVFTSAITGLTAGTLYHYRAFATNSAGTGYGADLTFTTGIPAPVLPTVQTITATQISQTTAIPGGLVTSDGGAPVTVRGVCYGLTANPTTGGSCTTNGIGLGQFSSPITGLSASTLYHIRAYAVNSVGTSYGADLTFTTSSGSGITGSTFIIAEMRKR